MSHIFGLLFSANRYKRYKPYVSWKEHSKYKGLVIERAFIPGENGIDRDKALYRAYSASGDDFIVGESLAEIKRTITKYLAEGPGPVVGQ